MILIREAYPEEKETIAKMLGDTELPIDNDVDIVVESEGVLLGYGGFDFDRKDVLLKSVYITPDHRGQRLGDGLVRAIINYADRRNINKIYISDNNADEYFKRFGFKNISNNKNNKCFFELDVKEFFNNLKCQD